MSNDRSQSVGIRTVRKKQPRITSIYIDSACLLGRDGWLPWNRRQSVSIEKDRTLTFPLILKVTSIMCQCNMPQVTVLSSVTMGCY